MNFINKIVLIILIGVASCKGKESSKDEPVTLVRSESEINKIKLTDFDNRPIDLNQYRGKTIFINFWATWCKPCIKEMPSIQRAQDILKNENVIFLFASDETSDEIEEFKAANDYNFNYVLAQNLVELNIMALPTTFIFNPEGKLVFSEMGARQWDDKNNIDLILKIKNSK